MQLLTDNFLFDFHMYCEQRHCVSLFSTTFSSMLEQETKHSIVLEGRNSTLLWNKGSPCLLYIIKGLSSQNLWFLFFNITHGTCSCHLAFFHIQPWGLKLKELIQVLVLWLLLLWLCFLPACIKLRQANLLAR